jgi:magnesium transporter
MKVAEEQRAVGELLAPEITELLESKQTGAARAALMELLDAEIAELLMALEPEHRIVAFRLLPRDRAPDIFAYFDQEEQEQLVSTLTSEQAAAIFNAMDPDDRVNFFEDAPEELASRLLALMHPEERAETEKILEYPEESVGRLMTPEYLTVRPEWTIAEAIRHLRAFGRDAETINTLYVVDLTGRLINHISLRKVILGDPEERISKYLEENIETVRLNASADREMAVRTMEKYDLPVVPVVDDNGVMVGIVTFDDVADVAEEEVTEDVQKMGGMAALESPYLSAPLLELVHKRVVWLVVLFIGGLLTITAMGMFEESIQRYMILALFVPLIIASGGNSGSQAATLTIRALAVGDLDVRDWWHVCRRELVTGLMMGTVLGLIGLVVGLVVGLTGFGGHAQPLGESLHFGFAIGTSIVGVVIVGTLVGSMLPFLLKRLGFDPAHGSTPMVATIVDVCGLLIYFTVALLILRG